MRITRSSLLLSIITFTLVLSAAASAQGPIEQTLPMKQSVMTAGTARHAFSYQGHLNDKSGTPLSGTYTMVFQLWDAATNGTQMGDNITVSNVLVENGLFSAIIPVPDGTFTGEAVWLRIKVGNEWLEPRQEILSVPYAMGLVPGATIVGDQPDSVLRIENSGTGIWARATAPDQCAIFGYAAATTGWSVGVAGDTYSPEGAGVVATNFATTGYGSGVWGNSQSPQGKGVSGLNDAGGTGVEGAASSGGDGIHGWTSGGEGFGVWGGTDSILAVGAGGWHSGGGTGMIGESQSGTGIKARSASWRPFEAYGSSWEDAEFYITNDGNVYADGTYQSPAADFAEMLPAQAGLEPGDVLVIGSDGKLIPSSRPYQTTVAGVHSTRPGFLGGASEGTSTIDQVPLAIVGVVPAKACTENGPIQPGDLLASSSTPGYAMKAGANPPLGSVIGKALTGIESGNGMIQMLVTLQ